MLCLALSAYSQDVTIMEDVLPNGGSGINQLSENIQSMLEPVGGDLVSGDDPMATDSPGDGGDGEEQVPVDGGLSLLLAAGAAYGARRLRKSTMEKKKAKSGT